MTPRAKLHAALDAMLDAAAAVAPVAADEAIQFPFGLETNAARELVRTGRIGTAKIGRKRYARRSAVLAALDAIAAEQERAAKAGDAQASYLALVGGGRK